MTNAHRVVVLGAGYTGMLCAIRLAHRTRRDSVRITVVNPSVWFTERLRLHQIAAGQELPGHRVPDLLAGTGVAFRQGRATAIHPDRHTVEIDHADVLGYDTLVYALGATTDTAAVPGADRHAHTLDSRGAAMVFAARLDEMEADGGAVTVCGGGPTGVEAAAEVAECHPGLRVTLVTNGLPGADLGAKARAHLDAALDRLGVTVRTGSPVATVRPDAVELLGGEVVASDACLWTAGVVAAPLAADSGIAVDDRGRLVVDSTLRSVSHPDVHAVGDAAAVRQPWGQLHGTCQSGMPTAAHTADEIARALRGEEPEPFRFGYFHQSLSLGRRDAVTQFTQADGTPRRACFTGRAAAVYKDTVVGSPLWVYRLSRRMNVSVTLSKGGRAARTAVV